MNKYKTKISFLLVCIMFFVIITFNIKSNALELSVLRHMNPSEKSNVVEYNIPDDEYIDINNISIEAAVDNNCESDNNDSFGEIQAVNPIDENQVTGSITPVSTEAPVQVENNNSNIYYMGDAAATIDMENDAKGSADSGNGDYYIEDWQSLDGDLSIHVNKQASCVTVYKGETPIRAMICSAGETTPEGTFYMQMQWDWLALIEGQYGRYCSQISGDYLFHSVPYNSMDIYDLDTEMYNQLGTLCSHGCVRLEIEDAKWIYDNCSEGTEIIIYNDENPGPMGKPGFEQIPADQTWDPTDIEIQ